MPDDFDFSQPRRSSAKAASDQPILTLLTVFISIVLTAAYWTSKDMKGSAWYVIGHAGVASPFEIWSGRYWAMATCIFLHANPMHILFNMYWLWHLGKVVETAIHPLSYLLFMVCAAIIGSGVEMWVSGTTGIGMSGVVYALFGLMWAGRGSFISWRGLATRDNLNLFIGWGVLCIVATYMKFMSIANGAHAAGLLFGLCVGYIWYSPRKRPVYIIPLTLLSLMTVMAAAWMPWSESWKMWHENPEMVKQTMETIRNGQDTPEAPDSGGETQGGNQ